MSISRKHFEAIARAILASPLSETDKMVVASQIAVELVAFNDRFEPGRFITAASGRAV